MVLDAADLVGLTRRRWRLGGQVQGVGFRPFIYRVAQQHGLGGFVCNDAAGVTIEAEGPAERVERFAAALTDQLPPLARLEAVACEALPPRGDGADFVIVPSQTTGPIQAAVAVDTVVCDDCLREMLDPADRRHGYGLINCTQCGPRLSIIHRVPYDRANTTMAAFAMCGPCRREYEDPADRRFHAQPTACPTCGPRLELVSPRGVPMPGDPIAQAAAQLSAGGVVAVKGLGGFHLAVRADDERAVARLRQLKQRDAKPFALMCGNLAEARRMVALSQWGAEALCSAAGPIVLARRRPRAAVADAVAPGCHRLGVMLPATPIQHLLMAALSGGVCDLAQRRDGSALGALNLAGLDLPGGGSLGSRSAAPGPSGVEPSGGGLVMTSGNRSDEPLAIDNAEALSRLGGMCDALLWHDRPIARCVDDSVVLDMGDGEVLPIRRARGYAPAALDLPVAAASPGLCVGGHLKNTVAVVHGGQAVVSQHLGDLEHPLAFEHFQRAAQDMQQLFAVQPRWIAHDAHPQYLSTHHARRLARRYGVPLVAVQHHHAHAASVLAEHGQRGPAVAVVCDGVGYGDDGTIWGGEVLLADLRGYRRMAAMEPLNLPGGDSAARDTRRCALALLHQALGDDLQGHPAVRRLIPDARDREMLLAMLRNGVGCVGSSAAGRVFDGVAALLGLVMRNDYEAQAALALEAAATAVSGDGSNEPATDSASRACWRIGPDRHGVQRIDLAPMVHQLLRRRERGEPVCELAMLFHQALAGALAEAAMMAAQRSGVRCVVLSGGVFCNRILTLLLTTRLERCGLDVLRHRRVPANDGGLALGQAAVAAARLGRG